MNPLYLLSVPAFLLAFFYLYVLVMGFYRASLDGRLTGIVKWLAYPAVAVGLLFDLVCNWTIASVVFAEPPTRPLELVTNRLSRYLEGPDGWRKTRATWVCQTLLDLFDPRGKHCHPDQKTISE
jgi:uncharacterized membrane protein YhdT